MTISHEVYVQSAIRGDMLQLEKLLEICNVPKGKVKEIKNVFIRAVARGSDYGYGLGYDDKLKEGERSKYCELMRKYEVLQATNIRMSQTNKKLEVKKNYYQKRCENLDRKVKELKNERKG